MRRNTNEEDDRGPDPSVRLEDQSGRFGDEDAGPTSGYERPGYGRGEWGADQQRDWRGPGEMPGYREASDRERARPFSQSTSGGQIPGEMREWGRNADRGPDADPGPVGGPQSQEGGTDEAPPPGGPAQNGLRSRQGRRGAPN